MLLLALVLFLKGFPGLSQESKRSDSQGGQMQEDRSGQADAEPVLVSVVCNFGKKIKKKVPTLTLKSCVTLDFSNKTVELVKSKNKNPYSCSIATFLVTGLSFFSESSMFLCPLIWSLLGSSVEVPSLCSMGYPSSLFPDFWNQDRPISSSSEI